MVTARNTSAQAATASAACAAPARRRGALGASGLAGLAGLAGLSDSVMARSIFAHSFLSGALGTPEPGVNLLNQRGGWSMAH
jgi:hypothetical protein